MRLFTLRDAEHEFVRQAGSPQFLWGSYHDRQTAALHTHKYRREMGVLLPCRADKAGAHVVDAKGESRTTHWQAREGIQQFVGVASQIRNRTYKAGLLRIARWPKENGRGWRVIAMPSLVDRLVGAVLLEVVEPILDPMLSDFQHGYRASSIQGHKLEAPGFPGIARGSTEIVARRILRAVRGGHLWLVELDIVNAFPNVDRKRLCRMLIRAGASRSFARMIIRALGDRASDEGDEVEIAGIPLGHPIGPLLFNFYVRSIHSSWTPGTVLTSYADNIFVAAREKDTLDYEINRINSRLSDLGLEAKVEQQALLEGEAKLNVLKEWKISLGVERAERTHQEQEALA